MLQLLKLVQHKMKGVIGNANNPHRSKRSGSKTPSGSTQCQNFIKQNQQMTNLVTNYNIGNSKTIGSKAVSVIESPVTHEVCQKANLIASLRKVSGRYQIF